MKRLLLLAMLSAAYVTASFAAETILQEFSWQEMARAGQIQTGKPATLPDQSVALKIENPGPGALDATLFVVDAPKISGSFYAVSGEVRSEDVAGNGVLEMWSHFEDGAFFTRSMAEAGPLAKLRGTAEWRPFCLPFNATGAKLHPKKLVINLHLPGKGTVFLRKVRLTEASSFGELPGMGGFAGGPLRGWWRSSRPGLIGGLGGALIGCLASLMEWKAAHGKSRRFVLGGCRALIGAGLIAIAAAAAAMWLGYPDRAWPAVLLLGALCVVIFPFRMQRYQTQYRNSELRRMAAMDAA